MRDIHENRRFRIGGFLVWCPWQESDLRPSGPEPDALSTELQRRGVCKTSWAVYFLWGVLYNGGTEKQGFPAVFRTALPMDVSIIIVNYRSREKTRNCLLSLRKAELSGISHEIILVDNSEEDDFGEAFRNEFSEAIFLRSETNGGMGSGNNLGANEAKGTFLLILNPDTVVRPDAIPRLFRTMKDREDIGIAGPKLLNPDGTLQYSCLRFPKVWTPILRRTLLGRLTPHHLGRYLMTDFDHQQMRDVDWMMGSCLLIRADFYRRAGGFDERFFMYFEDIDLCRRAWREGLRVVYCPDAVVVHDHARGSARARWFIAPFTSRLAREHIRSWVKYAMKWKCR